MVKVAARGILLLAVLPAASSCFDVHQVAPERWIVDDFAAPDGGTRPDGGAATGFEPWGCWPQKDTDCEFTTVDGRTVLHLGAVIFSAKDPKRAEVATFAAPPIDLTPYNRLGFGAKLGVGMPAPLNLKVQLTCDSVLAKKDHQPTANPRILTTFAPKDSEHLELYDAVFEEFSVPADGQNPVDKQDCLAHINSIKITVDFNYEAQIIEETRVDLSVDDIWLEPRR
jgi:hypothetical protein